MNINSDPSCSRMSDKDMALGGSLGPATTMVSGGSVDYSHGPLKVEQHTDINMDSDHGTGHEHLNVRS